jgi:hypothetical protein
METPRTDQSVSDLTFCVLQRPVHPELFEIHRTRQFFQGDYEVAIWVTNCGHVVSVFRQGKCLTELICPPDQMLPKSGLVQQGRFRGEKSLTCASGPSLRYMVNYQVEEMSRNLFRQCHSELVKAGKRRGMFVSFPQWARTELVPFSYLDYEARPEELRVHTYHAFPEHHTLLKTQSLFDLRQH